MDTNLTPAQRLTCLLALLDDAIKKDEERTPGEWILANGQIKSSVGMIANPPKLSERYCSHGRNARATRYAVEDYEIRRLSGDESSGEILNSILSLYPDEILKRYLK